MGGKKPLRRPLWPPTRATASNYYPLGLDGAGGAAKPLLRAPKKPAPLHGRLPAFSGAVDAFERARKCFLEWRYFFSIILSEFLKNRVALQGQDLHPPGVDPREKRQALCPDGGVHSSAGESRLRFHCLYHGISASRPCRSDIRKADAESASAFFKSVQFFSPAASMAAFFAATPDSATSYSQFQGSLRQMPSA